jgi:subtilase family protein/fibronectin type III domain protein
VTVGAMADPQASDWDTPLGFDLASFSGRGPTSDGRIKPDIVAPGVDITAADAAATENGYSHTGYASHSGTSQSAPFTAGVEALMLDANPSMVSTGTACPTSDGTMDCLDGVYDATMQVPLMAALRASAVDWGPAGPDNDYGYGRLDAYAAVDTVSSLSGSGGPAVPTHSYVEGALAGTGATATHALAVTGTNYPISVTFVMPTWTSATTPNFDIALLDPSGAQVATSFYKDKRQETIGYQPATTGTYTLLVTSMGGSGPYWFDASFSGAAAPGPTPTPTPTAAPTPTTSPSPTATPPPPPAGVTATAASLTQINVAWSDCVGETGYQVERALASAGPWSTVATLATNVNSYADKNLQSGTTYYYRVSSFNTAGNSAPSSTASAKTMSDTKAPTTPSGVKATGGKGKVSLTWSASTDTGGSGLAGYKVYRSTSSSGTYTQVATTTTTSYTDTAVAARSTYYYYVIAYDGSGNNSAKSATVNAKVS